MLFTNKDLGVSFEVADRFTVRQQLAFREAIGKNAGESSYERYWHAAHTLITDWQCELVPEPGELDLDAAEDVRIANIVQWTANTIAGHMLNLETPSKK